MPRIMPEPRYFSMPSSVVGAVAFRKAALNCRPWVRSLTQDPEALTNSPAEIRAAWPTTVTGSRCPRTLTRSTQKPVSALWKVTRSTSPARASVGGPRSVADEVFGAGRTTSLATRVPLRAHPRRSDDAAATRPALDGSSPQHAARRPHANPERWLSYAASR